MSIREFSKQLNNRPKVKGIKCLEETVERDSNLQFAALGEILLCFIQSRTSMYIG